jgi:hypothetical protein
MATTVRPCRRQRPGLPGAALALAMCSAMAMSSEPAAPLTVYRCTDSSGQLSGLRDTPCPPGQRQQVLQMTRPVDPPPAAKALPRPVDEDVADAAPRREVRTVMVQPPQPMYACTREDGTVYTSDDAEGNPRWVPVWMPVVAGPVLPPQPSIPVPPAGSSPAGSPPVVPIGGAQARPRPPQRHPPYGMAMAGGSWVRDPCQRIPQAQVCARLSNRRYEILRTYHAATPSGRQALDREQALLDARMANDCR